MKLLKYLDLSSISITRKLTVGLGFLVVLGVVTGATGLYFIGSIEKTLNGITDVAAPTVETSDDLIANIWEANKVGEEIIADEDLEDVEVLSVEFDEMSESFTTTYAELKTLVTDPALLDTLEEAIREHDEFLEHGHEMIAQHKLELSEEITAERQLDEFDASGAALITMLDEFANENEAEMAKAEDEGDRLAELPTTTPEDINAVLGNLFENEYPAVEAALKLQRIVIEMQDTAGEYLAIEEPEALQQPLAEFNALAEAARPHFEVLTKLAETEEDKADARELIEAFGIWQLHASEDEALFDTHRDMLQAEYAADAATEAMENDADRVAAALDQVAEAADAISDAADEEAGAVVALAQTVVIGVVLALIALSGLMMVMISRTVTRPINQMTDAMQKLASGNMDVDVPARGRGDEIGAMADTVQVFQENAIEAARLREEQARNEERAEHEKREATLKLADDLEASVKSVVEGVAGVADDMKGTASTMSAASEQTTSRASAVASASEEATTTAQTVASAAEQLSNSIQEISKQVTEASSVAMSGKGQAESTNATVKTLADGAQKIGDVVNLINDIAEQTNLLALNATIEAARAGEAGKGFAVVASEVKSLANQTAKATEEISQQIGTMQDSTKQTVHEIEGVVDAMSKISEMTAAVAAAVEEQNAATQDITHNIQQTASGTQDVSSNITEVTAAAQQSSEAAGKVVDVVGQLTEQSDTLRTELEKFLETLRAA